MSVEAITWAYSQKAGSATAKSVLVAMANCASPDFICWPSMAYLQAVTEQDRKTVLANIKRLKHLHLIADTEVRTGRTGQVVVYRLNPEAVGQGAQNWNGSEIGTVPFFPPKGPVFPAKRCQKRDTEPKGTVSEPSKAKSVSFALPGWVPVESWDAWVEMRKAIKKPLTPRALQLAVGKLARLQEQGHDAAAVLDQSTLNSWQDLYALKGSTDTTRSVAKPWEGAR